MHWLPPVRCIGESSQRRTEFSACQVGIALVKMMDDDLGDYVTMSTVISLSFIIDIKLISKILSELFSSPRQAMREKHEKARKSMNKYEKT